MQNSALPKVYNPELLTPNALRLAQGQAVLNITDEDWDSLYKYWDRLDALKPVFDKLDRDEYLHH